MTAMYSFQYHDWTMLKLIHGIYPSGNGAQGYKGFFTQNWTSELFLVKPSAFCLLLDWINAMLAIRCEFLTIQCKLHQCRHRGVSLDVDETTLLALIMPSCSFQSPTAPFPPIHESKLESYSQTFPCVCLLDCILAHKNCKAAQLTH